MTTQGTHTDRPSQNRPSQLARMGMFTLKTLVVVLLVATAAALLGSTHWLLDLVAQFKVQWSIGFLGLIPLLALGRSWRWVGVGLIGLAINAVPIFPYFVGGEPPVAGRTLQFNPESSTLRLMSFNLLSSNHKYADVIEYIRAQDPDFVILLEVDSRWQTELAPLTSEFECQFDSREDNFGLALLSKHRWKDLEIVRSQTLGTPSIDATFEFPNALPGEESRLRIIATHPIPPLSDFNWRVRNEQLINIANRFDSSSRNILAGDFNLTPWSPQFSRILEAGQLVDSGIGFGVTPTWYRWPTWVAGLKIDHILVGKGIVAVDHQVGPDLGSDHRAVIFDFQVPAAPAAPPADD